MAQTTQNFPDLFEIPENYPANISSEIGFKTVQFIKNAPFQPDYWQLWKRLYKLCETHAIANPQDLNTSPDLANLLMQALVRLDHTEHHEKNQDKNHFPTWKTLLYMKRRARRLLKFLAIHNPDVYIRFSLRLLETKPTQNEEKGFLESNRWLSYYIIYAKSRQILQKNCYNDYVADWTKWQYNNIQSHAHEVWDNDAYTSQIVALWDKTDKADILEWLYYWHKRNNIALPRLTDAQLVTLFESENAPLLHHVATQQAYQTYTMQGLSANLHAYMYFYASHNLRQKITQIRENRPKMDDFWQKIWVETYSKVTFQSFKNGNYGKRVEQAMSFLLEKHKNIIDSLTPAQVLEIAPALFALKNPKIQEIAFLKVKNATHENIGEWVQAWNNDNRSPQNQHDLKSFERLLDVAMPIYKRDKKKLYPFGETIGSFVQQESYFMVWFGAKITIYADDWEVYNPLIKITSDLNCANHTKKYKKAISQLELLFGLEDGVNLFLRVFKYSSYMAESCHDSFWQTAKRCNANKILDYYNQMLERLITNNTLANLQKLYNLYPNAQDAQNFILKIAPNFHNIDAINRWNIESTYFIINNRHPDHTPHYKDFVEQMFWFVFQKAKCSEISASGCFDYIANNSDVEKFVQNLWQNIMLLDEKKQNMFIKVLSSDNVSYLHNYSQEIPEDFYKKLVLHFSYNAVIDLIQLTEEKGWKKHANILLERFFELGKKEQGFWENLLPKITNNANLGTRILQNPTFATYFKTQKNPDLLNIVLPEYEEILFDWLWSNTDLLLMDSQNLFKACLHKLPSLRKFALNYALKQGLTTYFSLKLLESDMPDAMRTAQTHIENIDAQDKIFLENVLAICDSPHRGTRKFAESILLKNKNVLLEKYDILNYLQENSDITIQNFVAKTLVETKKTTETAPKTALQTDQFTKEIFRQQNRNRQTKEILKQEVSLISTNNLLEIARKGSPKDKEWAIAQLTLKAMAGEKIEGFGVEV